MTNEQWLKSLSTEELAEKLTQLSFYYCEYPYCCKKEHSCLECRIAWLKQERGE